MIPYVVFISDNINLWLQTIGLWFFGTIMAIIEWNRRRDEKKDIKESELQCHGRNKPEVLKKIGENTKRAWQNPISRKKYLAIDG